MEVWRDIPRRIDENPDRIKGMSYGYCMSKRVPATRCLAWVSLKWVHLVGPHREASFATCFMANDMWFIVSSFNYQRAHLQRNSIRLLIAALVDLMLAPSTPIRRHLLIASLFQFTIILFPYPILPSLFIISLSFFTPIFSALCLFISFPPFTLLLFHSSFTPFHFHSFPFSFLSTLFTFNCSSTPFTFLFLHFIYFLFFYFIYSSFCFSVPFSSQKENKS